MGLADAGKREYVQVLRLLESFPLAEVEAVVREALKLGRSRGGSIDCDDLSLHCPERKEETREFGGEVCTDEAKSTQDRPPYAGGPPNPVLLGLENGSSFPNTVYAAIFGADGGHLGNVGRK
jgi:hypothetical protein